MRRPTRLDNVQLEPSNHPQVSFELGITDNAGGSTSAEIQRLRRGWGTEQWIGGKMREELDLWSLIDDDLRRRLKRRWIELPTGVSLHVVERPGDGAPVICLHGIWDWWGYFRAFVAAEPDVFGGRPVLMVDLRGHGASAKPQHGFTLSCYADDIVALIHQQPSTVGLVGHSLGALTALITAGREPERVDLLVLEDPPLPLVKGGSDIFRGVYEMRQMSLDDIAEEFRIWRPWVSNTQALESAMCLKTTVDGVFTTTFGADFADVDVPLPKRVVDAPTLVIRAGNEEQRALRAGGIELLQIATPQLRVQTLAGTSHTVLRDAPEAYIDTVRGFVASVV
jgi:pimeloyl-ACP methyl ester carboxylesterase